MCLGAFALRLFVINVVNGLFCGGYCCVLGFVIVCIEVYCFGFWVMCCDLLVGLG